MTRVVEKLKAVQDVLEEVKRLLDIYDPERTFKFQDDNVKRRFEELRERFRDLVVEIVCGNELNEAYRWREILLEMCNIVKRALGLVDIIFSKELSSFLEDPRRHLKKKIFNYMYDLFRGKMKFEQFSLTAHAAIMTSLRTNMRQIYQSWVFLAILYLLGQRGFRITYPEFGILSLERHSKQKLGYIPPNAILTDKQGRSVSFFIEAPRPITWEDTEDLSRIWKLYTALRPDMMAYSGSVYNIVKLDDNPPILKPDIIIECKELADWYLRVRYMRGPLARPLTAEEWRSKWIEGLKQGLAEALGVELKTVDKMVREKKTIKLTDIQIVTLYKAVYKPNKMFIVSRTRVPDSVKKKLEELGIDLVENVEFNVKAIEPLVEEIVKIASRSETGRSVIDTIENLILRVKTAVETRLGTVVEQDQLVQALTELISRHLEELLEIIRSKLISSSGSVKSGGSS